MSLVCRCGYRIAEVIAPDPQRANFIRDEDDDALSPQYGPLIAAYIRAVQKGSRAKRAWLDERFGKGYPDNISEGDVILDIRNQHTFEYTAKMYLCESCGRLLVESKRSTYKSFVAEDDEPLTFQRTVQKQEGGDS